MKTQPLPAASKPTETGRYVTMARTWGTIIFVVGLIFLIFPNRAGHALDAVTFSTQFYELFGAGGGAIWKAILLGGVSAFYLLTFWSAARPTWRLPYAVTLAFSAVWTLIFVVLAIVHAPIWGAPAFVSALCGLTLWLSREASSGLPLDS